MAANADQPFDQERCLMTLEELVAKVKATGTDIVNSIDLWVIDAELWMDSGLDNLISGNIMQLTLGQLVFTVFVALVFGWWLLVSLRDWYTS